MRILKLLSVTLLFIAVPLALVGTNARIVINSQFLYEYGFDKYDIVARTGIERKDLLYSSEQIIEYFSNGEELLELKVPVNGIRRSIYSEREILHMRDVKNLVVGLYLSQAVSIAYIAVFSALSIAITRGKFVAKLAKHFLVSGMLTLAIIAVAGLLSAISFESVFLAFHLISFSNDLWQLDPSRHYLIAMFPQNFFFDATMAIAIATVFEALLLTLLSAYSIWIWSGKRFPLIRQYVKEPLGSKKF